ncbi:MAG: CoB--CoM heterodisulfide reductase iron-sulfur subunit B family protein [Candidatus Brocadiia bacterium]
MKSIGYYPGCALACSGIELDLSIRELSRIAGVELCEIADWNCCGASSAHSTGHELAVALPYRVLALAEAQGRAEILAPCASCFSRLKGTLVRLRRNPEMLERMAALTGQPCKSSVAVVNVLEYLNRLLKDGLAGKFTAPLKGVKVAAYYGCLLSRGEDIVEGDDAENPTGMEAAIRAAGCEVVPWNFATECCGGAFSLAKPEAVVELSAAILGDAEQAGAQMIVTGCPMCHSNLDMRQRAMSAAGRRTSSMPVLYLSELLGLAAGIAPKAIGLDRHFTDAMSVAGRSA